MNKLEFDIYVTPDGKCPFDDWYNELPAKDVSKLDAVIAKIQEQGIPVALKMQWVKKLDDEIWEIRSTFASNTQRACYFRIQGTNYLITHGFTKKTQKTPQSEIDKAHTIKNAYEKENRNA